MLGLLNMGAGAAGGVGLIVAKVPEGPDQGRLVISQVIPFGAAVKQTMLQKDDVIIKIDGIQTQLLNTQFGHPSPLCGPGNTTVTLQILRVSVSSLQMVFNLKKPVPPACSSC